MEMAGNVASPGQQELVEVLAEIRAWMPSLQPDMSLDNTKGKGRALRACILLSWGNAISSFCTTHANECQHNQEEGRGSLLLTTAWQMGFILSSWSLGVASHTFVTCRCGGCHGAWLCSVTGGQTAIPSSQSLRSRQEMPFSGFLHSMENSAASLLPNTAYERVCQSVSRFILVLDWVWLMPRKSMEVIQALRGMDIFCPRGPRGSCACESSGNR